MNLDGIDALIIVDPHLASGEIQICTIADAASEAYLAKVPIFVYTPNSLRRNKKQTNIIEASILNYGRRIRYAGQRAINSICKIIGKRPGETTFLFVGNSLYQYILLPNWCRESEIGADKAETVRDPVKKGIAWGYQPATECIPASVDAIAAHYFRA